MEENMAGITTGVTWRRTGTARNSALAGDAASPSSGETSGKRGAASSNLPRRCACLGWPAEACGGARTATLVRSNTAHTAAAAGKRAFGLSDLADIEEGANYAKNNVRTQLCWKCLALPFRSK